YICGIPVPNQIFGLARSIDQSFLKSPYDGILGFGPDPGSRIGTPTTFTTLANANNLKCQCFGVYLGRTEDGTGALSRLTIGYYEPSRMTSEINYIPLMTDKGW